jgi:hypothetical protein
MKKLTVRALPFQSPELELGEGQRCETCERETEMRFPCVECGKRVCAECKSYGHDCEVA